MLREAQQKLGVLCGFVAKDPVGPAALGGALASLRVLRGFVALIQAERLEVILVETEVMRGLV